MKTNLIILILFVISTTAMIVAQDNVGSIDKIDNDDVLVGKVDRNVIQKGHFGEYFLKEYPK